MSPQAAQAICDAHAQKAMAAIRQLKGYTVTDSASSCTPEQDELSSTDYLANSSFLLTKQPSGVMTASDAEALKRRLPIIQEGCSIRNILDSNAQSFQLCASSGAYLDNDGSYYSQGNRSNRVSFYIHATDLGYSDRCLR